MEDLQEVVKISLWLIANDLIVAQVWSESLLCTQCLAKDPWFLHADSEDSDQTGRMPRLIWVFAGAHTHFVGFVMSRLKFCLNVYLGVCHM